MNLISTMEDKLKFKIEDLPLIIEKIRKIARFEKLFYIKEIIYSDKNNEKIKLIVYDNFKNKKIKVIYNNFKGDLYNGKDIKEAIKAIRARSNFRKKRVYEKIKIIYISNAKEAKISLSIYNFGDFLEIKGKQENIIEIASNLGFKGGLKKK